MRSLVEVPPSPLRSAMMKKQHGRFRVRWPPRFQAIAKLKECYCRLVGQMIMVGFDGISVTPEIRMMIEKYYVGNIILTRRNIQGRFLSPW